METKYIYNFWLTSTTPARFEKPPWLIKAEYKGSPMAKIELIVKPIYGGLAHHEFILMTNNDGSQYYISGQHQVFTPSTGLGNLFVHEGSYVPDTVDFPSIQFNGQVALNRAEFNSWHHFVTDEGSDIYINSRFASIRESALYYDSLELPYFAEIQNSNSLASQSLRDNGYDPINGAYFSDADLIVYYKDYYMYDALYVLGTENTLNGSVVKTWRDDVLEKLLSN